MDISELFVPIVVLLIGAALAVAFFLARHFKRSWLRIPVRLTASCWNAAQCPISLVIHVLFVQSNSSCSAAADHTIS
jgi:ABC-type arginine/histidine transport system permease subunit